VELFLVPGEGGDFSRACERHEVPEEILVTRLAPCDDMFLYSSEQLQDVLCAMYEISNTAGYRLMIYVMRAMGRKLHIRDAPT
jgi:hypothetical protein